MKVSQFVFLIIFIISLSFDVAAHRPIEITGSATSDNPVVIKDHRISQVAYTKLSGKRDVDYYLLSSVKKGEKIYTQLLIPQIDRLKYFEPEIAIIGPKLNTETDGINKVVIKELLEIENQQGIIIKRNTKKGKTFFEPFTQTAYWERQEIEITAPVGGNYQIAVFDIKDDAGKYVLTIGEEEKWGLKDLIRIPGIWWNVRMFAEKRISTYIISGILIILSSFLIYRFIIYLL
ncbi:MAG TPA: hypothetical protein VKY40_00710 [Halanaerobiales bacterium]|nr:hypothetical protein [Halanaerobiales bacterium]